MTPSPNPIAVTRRPRHALVRQPRQDLDDAQYSIPIGPNMSSFLEDRPVEEPETSGPVVNESYSPNRSLIQIRAIMRSMILNDELRNDPNVIASIGQVMTAISSNNSSSAREMTSFINQLDESME